jgi:hypothetical protein
MARRERIVAREALCNPRGVTVRMRLNKPASIAEEARQRNMRPFPLRSLLPGNTVSVARYPGMRKTRIRARGDRISCRDGGERWTRASATTEIKTDTIRCRGGGQANLILRILTSITDKTFFLGFIKLIRPQARFPPDSDPRL